MPELRSLQSRFLKAIQDPSATPTFIRSPFPKERMAVYRNTIQTNLVYALQTTFPGVWALLGEPCANGAAQAYLKAKASMPTTGCLDDFGAGFPAFLGGIDAFSSLPYLQDYGTYEWAQHVVYGAPDVPILSPESWLSLPEEKVEQLRLQLVPACFLLKTAYPLLPLREVVENPDADPIHITPCATYTLVMRAQGLILTQNIDLGCWCFLQSVLVGDPLGVCFERAMEGDPAFDLTSTLVWMLNAHLIEDVGSLA